MVTVYVELNNFLVFNDLRLVNCEQNFQKTLGLFITNTNEVTVSCCEYSLVPIDPYHPV